MLETAQAQNVDISSGLDQKEAERRLESNGYNELNPEEGETLWEKFVEQFKNPLILLLFGSAFISVLLGEIEDAISITLVRVLKG